MMDRRTQERILKAGNQCKPVDDRQAALIGAIVHVLLATGHFLPQKVAAVAAENMGWAMSVANNMDHSFTVHGVMDNPFAPPQASFVERIFPKRGYPTMPEISAAAAMFTAQYNPPEQAAA